MANQNQQPDNQPDNQAPDAEPAEQQSNQPAAARLTWRERWERIPPRYRTKKWIIGGGIGAAFLVIVAGNSLCGLANAPDVPEPEPVAAAAAPTPSPETSLLSERPTPTPLPSQYSFSHFVNEMSDCFSQRGDPASLEEVEASIMADVPHAVNMLMRLYHDNLCVEEDPWHQISGRVGWMLRAADVPLPELPEPQQ